MKHQKRLQPVLLRQRPLVLMGLLFLILMTIAAVPGHAKRKIKGTVFLDTNNNGIMDKGEKGIPGVAVSNQREIAVTDTEGNYKLPLHKQMILFVIKPAEYNLPLDSNNLPRFYYIHQPKGSPKGLLYPGIEPTAKRPKRVNFPLLEGKIKTDFNVIISGDPQTRTLTELGYFRDKTLPCMMREQADFYVAMGDILYNDLQYYPQMTDIVRQLQMPCFHVSGNHDINFNVPDATYSTDTFRRNYGPDYYSYNYGNVHFIILKSVKYHGWDQEKNRKGGYTGWVIQQQLDWIKQDLELVPEDHLVVFLSHIPLDSKLIEGPYSSIQNRDAIIQLVEGRSHVLALAGHTHFFEYLELPFPSISVGAPCGSWWHGPKDAKGIPIGLATGGAPGGYFMFHFKANQFDFRFRPVGHHDDYQIRVNSPSGDLTAENAANTTVNVNVFAGTPQTEVTYILDNGTPVVMKRKVMPDPFFKKLFETYPGDYKEWMKPMNSSHVWEAEAPLPQGLKPGIHRLEITTRDQFGHVYNTHQLFKIN